MDPNSLGKNALVIANRRGCGLFVFSVLLGMGFSVPTIAQSTKEQPKSTSSPATVKGMSRNLGIAVIYTAAFYDPKKGITRLLKAMKDLDTEFESYSSELETLQRQIQQLSNEGNRSASISRNNLESQLQESKRELQRKTEDAQTAYANRFREIVFPIFEDLDKALRSFAQQREITLIIDGSKMDQTLFYLSENLDLTSEFVLEFNRIDTAHSR